MIAITRLDEDVYAGIPFAELLHQPRQEIAAETGSRAHPHQAAAAIPPLRKGTEGRVMLQQNLLGEGASTAAGFVRTSARSPSYTAAFRVFLQALQVLVQGRGTDREPPGCLVDAPKFVQRDETFKLPKLHLERLAHSGAALTIRESGVQPVQLIWKPFCPYTAHTGT